MGETFRWGWDFQKIFSIQGGFPNDLKKDKKLNKNKSFFKWKRAKEYFSGGIVSKKIFWGAFAKRMEFYRGNFSAEEFFVGELPMEEFFLGGFFMENGISWVYSKNDQEFNKKSFFTENKKQN